MKKYKKIIAVALALLTVLLSACGRGGNDDTSETQDTAKIEASALSEYTVIVSKDITDEEREAINSLLMSINDSFGTLIKLKTDAETEETDGEILIGETDREQTQNVKDTLKYDDYYIGIVEEKLVVTGGSVSSTVIAIQKLEETVIANAGNEVFFSNADDALEYKAAYRYDDMKINGISVSEYTVVYANGSQNREKTLANTVKKAVISLCGIEVNVQPDTETAYGNVIYVGGKAEGALLQIVDGVIYVSGGCANDFFYATQTLIERMCDSSDGSITVADSEKLEYTEAQLDLSEWGVSNEMISFMSYNLQNTGAGQSGSEKYVKLASMIDSKAPDILAVQECRTSGAAAENLLAAMKNGSGYSAITQTGVNEAIIYNNSKFTLVENGYKQIGAKNDEYGSIYDQHMLWAKFKSNATGEEFAVVSVHIAYVEKANEVQLKAILEHMEENYHNVPTVLLGDFNLEDNKLDVKSMEKLGYVDCRKTANVAENATSATFPSKNIIIDYIFAKGMMSEYYETLTGENNPSDHRPIYAELYVG